jgi:hypothetical protein
MLYQSFKIQTFIGKSSGNMTSFFNNLGKRVPAVPTAAARYGAAGAIAGGTLATIKNFRKVMNKEISVTDAISNTFQQSLGTGISSAIGMSVITVVGLEGILAAAGIMVVAGVAKECIDSIKSLG